MNKNNKLKRILALATIIIILLLVFATLAVALLGAPKNILFALIFCDVVIPISIYALLLISKFLNK